MYLDGCRLQQVLEELAIFDTVNELRRSDIVCLQAKTGQGKTTLGCPCLASLLPDRACLVYQPTRANARNPKDFVAHKFPQLRVEFTTGDPRELQFKQAWPTLQEAVSKLWCATVTTTGTRPTSSV